MIEFLNFSAAEAVSIYIFLTVVLVSLVVLICSSVASAIFSLKQKARSPTNDERSWQKIAGGFGVFVVAILSQNAWVYATSLFIGGLIIASERFMRALAIIMKAQSKDLPDAINALGNLETRDATPTEIEQKNEEEAKQNVPVPPIPKSSTSKTIEEVRKKWGEQKQSSESAQRAVSEFFSSFFSDRFDYKSNVSISNNFGSVVADAALYDLVDSKLKHLIEIKYLDTDKSLELIISNALFGAKKALERFRFLMISESLAYAVVGKNLDHNAAERITREVEGKFENYVWVSVFNLLPDGSIQPIAPASLVEHWNKRS